MRFLLTALALLMMAAPAAQASENRITVSDLYNFVSNTNSAINNPNLHVSRDFLNRITADNAVFDTTVAQYNYGYNYNYADPWHRVWYANPAYGYYYRYPYARYYGYGPTSMRSMTKWDHINTLENKKRMIPGYKAQMEITNTLISPYAGTAVVDVDLKEYSLAYSPYTPALTQHVLNANSKCKLYLSKRSIGDIMLSRMDCNTNTSLPF